MDNRIHLQFCSRAMLTLHTLSQHRSKDLYHHIDPKHYWSDVDLVGRAKVGLCAGGLGKVCERQKVGDKNSCSLRGLQFQGSF